MRDLRRPLWIFGTLLAVPAAVLAVLGWRSLSREGEARRADAVREAKGVAERTVLTQADSLEALRAREERRPYYHYARAFQPEDFTSNTAGFLTSPLERGADDPRLLGWFQWTLLSSGGAVLETFPPGAGALEPGLQAAYGPALLADLRAAAAAGSLPSSRVVPTSLQTVAANEEKGQLLEEIEVANRERQASTARLDEYRSRVQTKDGSPPAIDVRSTPLSYAARAPSVPGPPLVAYRMVWVPPTGALQRDAPSDRWLLQGYALDPGLEVPVTWSAASSDVRLCRGDCTDAAAAPPESIVRRSLLDTLQARILAPPPPVAQAAAAQTVDGTWAEGAPVPGFTKKRSAEGGDSDDSLRRHEEEKLAAARAFGAKAPAPGPVPAPAAPPGDAAAPVAATLVIDPAVPAGTAADPSLSVVAVPAFDEIEAGLRAARNRFVLLLVGLLAVVVVGFATLLRSVRREVAVARKKEDFVAAVTHELKTPLAGIRMYADMLQGGFAADAEVAGSYAGRIVSEAKRLDALVDQVLALAAYDRGVASFRPVSGDLGAATREAAEAYRTRAREAGVSLDVAVEDGLPPVPFDPALAVPLVANLVDNAVKYSARSPTKEVAVRVRRDGPAHVAVEVADRGVGIPPEDRARVFEPFYRSGGEETRSAPGVGLGLALVRRYADAHGATVSLDSELGRGTTVSVRFPTSAGV